MFFKIWNKQFDSAEDLPFHLCNILTLVLPIALYYKSRWFFGILYFWVLVGTMQAILTPELKEPFPHFIYFRYWTVHCGLVMLIFYGLMVLKWKVYWKDIRNAIIGANVYVVFSFVANYFSGGNYFYTMHKPSTASLLDYLGPWPWYIFTGQLIMVLLFIRLIIKENLIDFRLTFFIFQTPIFNPKNYVLWKLVLIILLRLTLILQGKSILHK